MKLPGLKKKNRRARNVVIEEVLDEEDETPTCTFDEDADPSIERCWEDDSDVNATSTKNFGIAGTIVADQPLALAGAGAVLATVAVIVGGLVMRELKSRKQQRRSTTAAAGGATTGVASRAALADDGNAGATTKLVSTKEQPHGQLEAVSTAEATISSEDDRVKVLKESLEKEAKEKESLSDQNNFLKSALEERKTTVQMFTSELQSRDEQLANFEQEQVKVKDELFTQIESLKNELQTQEKMQQENLNNMDGQCSNLAGKVEGLMKELANREDQWEKFEKDAKAREVDSAAQIEAIKKEYAAKEVAQKEGLISKKTECADLSNRLEGLAKEMKDSEVQLSTFQQQREKWNTASNTMTRMLKEKRDEMVGLKTRLELFSGELKSRGERVVDLEQKLVAKKDLLESDLEDLRASVKVQTEEHDTWHKKTTAIERLLGERKVEAEVLTTKVESLTKELQSASEKVSALEAKVQDREFVILANKETMEKTLRDNQDTRSHWNEQHAEMGRLLKARQDEFDCLTARVEIFATELQSRESIVEALESKAKDKASGVTVQLASLKEELEGKQAFRDTWSESTKSIHRLLEEKKDQVVGLNTRMGLFHVELKKREEGVASLESILMERQDMSAAALAPIIAQLTEQKADLDKWTNSTLEIRELLQSRKDECVGLTTRLSLFKTKLGDYDKQVDVLTHKVDAKVGAHSNDIGPLRDTLQKQQQERDSWDQKTIDIGKQLEDRQNQCVGLQTRLVLFKQQTKFHQEQTNTLEAKANELQERFDLQIIPLQKELKVQSEGLESWKQSTVNVEELLKQSEKEQLDLTDELKHHIAKLQGCQKEVATFQTQVLAKGDTIASQKDSYLAEHQKEVEELENWASKTDGLKRLLVDKEGQIIGLTTRLDLFQTELLNRQTTVSDLETKFKDMKGAFEVKISTLETELQLQREQRDHCLESTLTTNKAMKEVKEPCIGLSTRLTLFKKELEGREERVTLLAEQVREKTEHALSVLEPLRKELQKQQDHRDKWNDSTLDIFWMLKARQDSTVGLTTRLELFMSELQNKEGAVEAAEAAHKNIVLGLAQMDNLKNEIKVQEEQMRKWQASTDELTETLKQKEQSRTWNAGKKLEEDIISLKAKLELFVGELERREEKVKSLQSTSIHRRDILTSDKAPLEKKIVSLKEDRDSWMEKTLKINQNLKDVQTEAVGLTTRWELFKEELRKRKESTATLEATVRDKEEHFGRTVNPYEKELQVQTDLRDKWLETIDKMQRLLKKKESECINFTTKMETAIDELSSRKEQVRSLEAQLSDVQELAVAQAGDLHKRLATAREGLETWNASTKNVNQLLKDKRQECANLRVRLQVFRRQVETQDSRIMSLEAAYQAKHNAIGAQLDDLQNQLSEQQSARDESVSTTLSINQAIKAKELQCTSITVRLSLFRTELGNRAKTVETLENKLNDAQGMSAIQLDPVKAKLRAQKEELAKWTENTNDIEQLLKTRDSERIGLATRLALFQSQLKTIEESVSTLDQRLQKRMQSATSEMAPFKNALDTQRAERDRWSDSTKEIHRLLQDRKTQILGLTTRLQLFKKEVKHRAQAVSTIEAKLAEKQEEIDSTKIEPVQSELATRQKERDEWAKTTKCIEDMLKSKHSEIDGLSTRIACFTLELQKREEACKVLTKKYNDNKGLLESQVQVLKSELAMQVEQRDKWRETTAEMKKQVQDRKVQCAGLTTRVELFQKEIAGHDEAIVGLKLRLEENGTAVAEVEELKKELKVQQESRDALNKAFIETDELLKEKKAAAAGLATRLVVFRQQLKERMDRLTATETKIKTKEDLSTAQIESLQLDLHAQQEQRDKWTDTTTELKHLLEAKERQCSIISAELELLTGLQAEA